MEERVWIDENLSEQIEPELSSFEDFFERGNRQQRRHPEYSFNDTRYKRPRKGQKFFN